MTSMTIAPAITRMTFIDANSSTSSPISTKKTPRKAVLPLRFHPTSASSSTLTSTDSQSNKSGSGRKIGTAIGAVACILLIACLGFCLVCRRRLKRRQEKIRHNGVELKCGPSSEAEGLELQNPLTDNAQTPGAEEPVRFPLRVQSRSQLRSTHECSTRPPALPGNIDNSALPTSSTSSIVHPALWDAAFLATRFLERPSPVPTPDPIQQFAKIPTHDETLRPLSLDENPLQPFPPRSPSNSLLSPRSPFTTLRPVSSNRMPPSPSNQLHPSSNQRVPSPPNQLHPSSNQRIPSPSIQLYPPTPRMSFNSVRPQTTKQSAKELAPSPPFQPSALHLSQPPGLGITPSTIKAELRNHPQPLQSNSLIVGSSILPRHGPTAAPAPKAFPLQPCQ